MFICVKIYMVDAPSNDYKPTRCNFCSWKDNIFPMSENNLYVYLCAVLVTVADTHMNVLALNMLHVFLFLLFSFFFVQSVFLRNDI